MPQPHSDCSCFIGHPGPVGQAILVISVKTDVRIVITAPGRDGCAACTACVDTMGRCTARRTLWIRGPTAPVPVTVSPY